MKAYLPIALLLALFPVLARAGKMGDTTTVQWQSLSGEWSQSNQGYVVVLDWVTVNEQGAEFFEIERSTDGTSFLALGQIPATGGSQTNQQYDFVDKKPEKVSAFYRVKAIYHSGLTFYSDIVRVEGEIRPSLGLFFTNPIEGGTGEITVTVEEKQSLAVSLYTIDGNPVCVLFDGLVRKGLHRYTIPRAQIPQGIFILRVDGEAAAVQKRVVIF